MGMQSSSRRHAAFCPHPLAGLAGLAAAAFLQFVPAIAAALSVNGDITTDTVWTAAMNPVTVESDARVVEDVRLRIEAGTHVAMRGTSTTLTVEGRLEIAGDDAAPATFAAEDGATEWGAIRVAGATATLDARHAALDRGQVVVEQGAAATIDGVSVAHVAGRDALVADAASTFTLRNATVDSVFRGLRVSRCVADIQNCEFSDVTKEGILFEETPASPTAAPSLRIGMPSTMLFGGPNTIRAELLDPEGRLDWRVWNTQGTVSAAVADTAVPVPLTTSQFEIFNGGGSVTFFIDPSFVPPPLDGGEFRMDVAVAASGRTASKRVRVTTPLPADHPVTGTLTGDQLVWRAGNSPIWIEGDVTVPEGETLTIHPGAAVRLGEKARIHVHGDFQALGTEDNPIYFYPVDWAKPWGRIEHYKAGTTSLYRNVFFVRGGDAPKLPNEHAASGTVQFDAGHNFMDRCVMVDLYGKATYMVGSNVEVELYRSMYGRAKHGTEMIGGPRSLISDCHYSRMNKGAGISMDQDCVYLGGSGYRHEVRRSILACGGDEGIDSYFGICHVHDCIIRDQDDKGLSLTFTDMTIENVLVFDCLRGIMHSGNWTHTFYMSDSTVADCAEYGFRVDKKNDYQEPPAYLPATLERCVIWGSPASVLTDYDPMDLTLNHDDITTIPLATRGTGTISTDPEFVDPAAFDYRLGPDSPARTAGPTGGPIGWKGFEPGFREIPTSSPRSTVAGCVFRAIGGEAISFGRESAGRVRFCLIEGCGTGIALREGSRVDADHNTVVDCAGAGILAVDPEAQGTRGDFDSWIVWGNGESLRIEGFPLVSLDRCDAGPDDGTIQPGADNLNADPQFSDAAGGDYRLRQTSPCAGTGTAGSNRGALPTAPSGAATGWVLK